MGSRLHTDTQRDGLEADLLDARQDAVFHRLQIDQMGERGYDCQTELLERNIGDDEPCLLRQRT